MKILIANDNSPALTFFRMGLARAFSACGYNIMMWDITKKSIFDALDEFEPNILLGQTYNISKAWIKAIKERPLLRVILRASDWGNISDNIDRNKYPILIANEKEIDLVRELRSETNRPDLLHIHYLQERLQETHTHWIDDRFKVISCMNAADIFDYTNGTEKEELKCDIGYVGGLWGYKAKTMEKWMFPLLRPDSPYNIKIFGNQQWPSDKYCGMLPNEEVKHLFVSSKICPNLSEPHSQDFGYDVIERPFKLSSCKAFCISDYVEDLGKIYPDIPMAKKPEDFFNKIEYYLYRPQERRDIVQACYEKTIESETYFSRIHNLFQELEMPFAKDKVLRVYEDIKKGMKL